MNILAQFGGQIITGLVTLVVGFGGAWLVLRGKYVDRDITETTVEAETTTKFLDGQMAFQKFVDEAVAKRVSEATAEMRQELDEIATKLDTVQRESHEMNNVIRSRETSLWLWNLHGREGDMPALPPAVMERLSLGHLINLSGFLDSAKLEETREEMLGT